MEVAIGKASHQTRELFLLHASYYPIVLATHSDVRFGKSLLRAGLVLPNPRTIVFSNCLEFAVLLLLREVFEAFLLSAFCLEA